MTRIIVMIVISLFLLASCGAKTISGEIVGKEYKEEWVQMIPIIHNINGVPVTQMIPVVHEEGYYIVVKPGHLIGNDDEKNKYIRVSKKEYDTIDVGDRYEGKEENNDE